AARDRTFHQRTSTALVGKEITLSQWVDSRLNVHVETAGREDSNGADQTNDGNLADVRHSSWAPPRWSVELTPPKNCACWPDCIWGRKKTRSGKTGPSTQARIWAR